MVLAADVRAVTPAGLVLVERGELAAFVRPAAREHVDLKATKASTWWFVADGREGCGGLLELSPRRMRLRGAYVAPEWRGQGIGTRLALGRIEVAERLGFVELETISVNPPFFERLGFRRVREIRPGSWRMLRCPTIP